MISVGSMGGGSKFYFSHLSEKDDYYVSKDQEEPGHWVGEGSELLGLSGQVERKEFSRVFDGYDPHDKRKLVQTAGRKPNEEGKGGHRPGWDFTISAVKSFSIVYELAEGEQKEELRRIYDRAIESTIRKFDELITVRAQVEKKITEVKAGLVAAAFTHHTARGQDGGIPSPQTHTHLTVFNVGVREAGKNEDGSPQLKTNTLEPRNLFELRQNLDAHFHKEMERGLNEAGYETYKVTTTKEVKGQKREVSWYELKDVPKVLMLDMSPRSRKIRENAKEDTGKERGKVSLKTRDKKNPDHTLEFCKKEWVGRAALRGLTLESISALKKELITEPQTERSIIHVRREAVEAAIKALTDNRQVFSEKTLIFQVKVECDARKLRESDSAVALEEYRNSSHCKLLGVERRDGVYYTTLEAREKHRERREQVKEPEAVRLTPKWIRDEFTKRNEIERREGKKPVLLREDSTLKDECKKWHRQGKKVIALTYSQKRAEALRRELSVHSGTISRALWENKKVGYGIKIDLRQSIVGHYRYITGQINYKGLRKYTGSYHKPSSLVAHRFKEATGQISRGQRKYLDQQLEREKFKIEKNSVILINEKHVTEKEYKAEKERPAWAQNDFSKRVVKNYELQQEITRLAEKKRATVIFAGEVIEERYKERQEQQEKERHNASQKVDPAKGRTQEVSQQPKLKHEL